MINNLIFIHTNALFIIYFIIIKIESQNIKKNIGLTKNRTPDLQINQKNVNIET